MIEINKKAKPFNPCEEILGTDVMYWFQKCTLTGSHYYLLKPTSKSRDVLVKFRGGKFTPTYKKLMAAGWKEADMPANVPSFYRFQKGDDYIIATSDEWLYDRWRQAADVCRLMNFDADPHYQDSVTAIFKVVVDGMSTVFTKQGDVTLKHVEQADNPDMDLPAQDGPQGGFGLYTTANPIYNWGNMAEAELAAAGILDANAHEQQPIAVNPAVDVWAPAPEEQQGE